MTKIVDLINFHTAYGEQVRLLEYFYNENQNHDHMGGYRPIRSHRQAFLELARAQLPDKSNKDKVFMLTGSFGTGKSHLCLMLANYFSLKPTEIEMQSFFENWAERDPAGAETIRNWRGDGRYLVAPCDFGEARSFEGMVLTAIQKALEFEGAEEIILNTHFKGALRQIDLWEQRNQAGEPSGVFDDFLVYLGGDDPLIELENLKIDLENNDSTAMQLFQDTYQKATGQKLSFKTDSLLAILRDLLSNTEFHKRYKGLVILADEFGYALDENRVSLSVFQGFAEMSKDGVAGMQLIFVGTGHRRFAAYGANTQLQIDFRVIQDRITEVSLESEELEQIIAALVSPKVDNPAWEQDVLKKNGWLLMQMASGAKKLKIFDYLSERALKEQIVTNIYPVHPMSTYCLTKMSQELGSQARSVFAFFREFDDESPVRGYSWYVQNTDVTQPKGELNIFTPDYLVKYFGETATTTTLTVRPEIRDYIRNYRAAVDEAQRFAYKSKLIKEIDPFTQQVLDLIFVYRVSNVNVVQPTLEYGLNLHRPEDKKKLTGEISALIKNKIIFPSPSGEYEFRRSDMADLDALITEQRQEILEQPLDLAYQITNLANRRWDIYTEAKGHNQDYLGDKRIRRLFATPQELSSKRTLTDGTEVSFWRYHEQRRLAHKSWNDRYDGTMVYVLCENETDIKTAQQANKSNDCENIIVGVPKTPIPVKETVINLLAVINFKGTDEYSKLDFQEKALVDELEGKENQKTGRVGDLIRARDRYVDAKDLYWYREDGKTHLADANNEYEPADVLMNRIFDKRNTISHNYLSKAHPKSFSGTKDTALREAVAKLVAIDRSVEIDHGEKENRGEIRYLKMALANEGVLRQEGDYDGNVAQYELENNPEKYRYQYPALADLIENLKNIKRGESVILWGLLSETTEAPYGLGPYALALFTACAFRYFGDELRLKINPQAFGYSPTDDPTTIIDVATGSFPTAVVERRSINPATSKLINDIYNQFSETPAPAATQQTLSEAWRALLGWWKNRTRLEKAPGIYDDDGTASSVVDLLSKLSEDPAGNQIFLEEIKQIYGFSPDAELEESHTQEIIDQLGKDKEIIESRAATIKATLVEDLSGLFDPQGTTYKDYTEAIYAWYNNLHPDQKLTNADWQTPVTQTLIDAIPKLQDLEKMFLELIPASYGFKLGKVNDWSHDQSASYSKQFEFALEKINNSLPKVPAPQWKTSVEAAQTYQGAPDIRYRNSVSLTVLVPDGGTCVRVTKNEDPIHAKQFHTVEKSSPWTLEIKDSCSYLLVTQNDQEDFSKVSRLNFTNLDEGNKLISESAPKLDSSERIYRFKNPVDKQGLVVLLSDIVDKVKTDKQISKDEIVAAFQEIAKLLTINSQEDKS